MVSSAVEILYQEFAIYPLADKIVGCPHCELDDAELGLHTKPLRELSWQDFGVYPFKAITTFGDVDDFKHFLPRILELYILDYDAAPYDFYVFLSKLDYAHWEQWPEPETDAVIFCIRTWLSTLDPSDKELEYEISVYEEVVGVLKEWGLESDV